MTVKTATASLSSSFILEPITGFRYYQQGQIDLSTGTIKPQSASRWSDLVGKTWAQYTNWQTVSKPIIWTGPLMDNGEVRYFTLTIESEFQGTVQKYLITTSTTGAFAGEEIITTVVEGDQNVEAFYGRYFYVTVFLTGSELKKMSMTATNDVVIIRQRNVNTATLAGTSSARTIALATPVSRITDLKITPQAATSYAVNLYVSDTATSRVLIPVILSKSRSAPQFVLYGIDNDPRDGIVDIEITTTPRQAMANGSLYVIQ